MGNESARYYTVNVQNSQQAPTRYKLILSFCNQKTSFLKFNIYLKYTGIAINLLYVIQLAVHRQHYLVLLWLSVGHPQEDEKEQRWWRQRQM